MKSPRKTLQKLFELLVAAGGIVLLAYFTFVYPPSIEEDAIPLILTAAFTSLLILFPFRILRKEIALVHLIVLSVGALYGPATAGWGATIGLFFGLAFRRLLAKSSLRWLAANPLIPREALYQIGLQIIPLAIALNGRPWVPSAANGLVPAQGIFIQAGDLVLRFALAHATILLIEFALHPTLQPHAFLRNLMAVVLIELLLLPYTSLTLTAHRFTGVGALAAAFILPMALSILLYTVGPLRPEIARTSQDLFTLNQISQMVRSSVDMDDLLEAIQVEVMGLLGIRNFYVALYDQHEQQLHYPLAVKRNQRQTWPPRPLADRLTDRVIKERRAILLAKDALKEMQRIGVPLGEDTLSAWLGVPLLTPDRVLGCLAVFSLSPETELTTADLNLMTTISGQVSVAFENALLYQQAQQRALQLEILNQTAAMMAASLELEEVLAETCKAVSKLVDVQRSAIYLAENDQVSLAHAWGLSEDFVQASQSFPITSLRARCLRTGKPVLLPSLTNVTISPEYRAQLEGEKIAAIADFPLTAPSGHIGFLSVLYSRPQEFPSDEVELLQTFASQAALAVSNAKLFARTDQALSRRAQQLTMLEAVGRQLAAATHSERLFDIIVNYALEFTGSPWGSLSTFDPHLQLYVFRASRGYQLDFDRFDENTGIVGRAIRTKQPVIVNDVSRDPDFVDVTDQQTASQLSVPLIYEDRILGALTLESPNRNAYTLNDRDFVYQLANQAAIAVVNAELYNQSQHRLRQQQNLYQMSTALVGNVELDNVLDIIARAFSSVLNAQHTAIYLWNDRTQSHELRTATPAADHPLPPLPSTISPSQISQASQTVGEFLRIDLQQLTPQASLQVAADTQLYAFPLPLGDQTIGYAITHVSSGQPPPVDERQLADAFAAQGSIAIHNALLFSDTTQGRDRLEAVLDSVGEGILMLDANGYITLVNTPIQVLLSAAIDELIGQYLPDLPEEMLAKLGYGTREAQGLIDAFSEGRLSSTPEFVYQVHDRHFERHTAPVWGEEHRAIGGLIVIRDVTEEILLQQARDLITQTLVHDLRSPLGTVETALVMIESAIPQDQRDELTEQSIEIGHRSLGRVLNLIESLLSISQLESGKIKLDLEEVDISKLISETLAELTPQAYQIDVALRHDYPTDLPPIHADKDVIQRVLINLLDNSLKYTPQGGEISVRVIPSTDDTLTFQVTDTGPGIPPEYRETVFKRFTQVPETQGRRPGSGLGLTFCRLAVEAHGGNIWIEETGQEIGTTFTFTLPLSPPANQS